MHELECQCYLKQLCTGIQFIHDSHYVHRDLKLSNIFLNDDMQIKIGDFGLATRIEIDDEKRMTLCGTPNYIAPEILDGLEGHSFEVDVWSLGVILYTMLVGKPPYESGDVKHTYRKIKQNSFHFPERCGVSPQARDLVNKMLVLNPVARLTLWEVTQHPWMKSRCGIPRLLPVSTKQEPPTVEYIKSFIPKSLGGTYQEKSAKDHDK